MGFFPLPVFTMQGNTLKPLEEEFGGQMAREGVLKCIEITPDLFDDAQGLLTLTGLDK